MKLIWKLVKTLKSEIPSSIVIMTGYHSMRMPEETLEESPTDVVLLSNHIDFVLRRLVPYIGEHEDWRQSCEIEGLVIRQDETSTRHTGAFKRAENLDLSPDVDRDLVQWKNYAYENGNYLQLLSPIEVGEVKPDKVVPTQGVLGWVVRNRCPLRLGDMQHEIATQPDLDIPLLTQGTAPRSLNQLRSDTDVGAILCEGTIDVEA